MSMSFKVHEFWNKFVLKIVSIFEHSVECEKQTHFDTHFTCSYSLTFSKPPASVCASYVLCIDFYLVVNILTK